MGISSKKKSRVASHSLIGGVAALTALVFGLQPTAAMADTAPANPTEPKTVSNDALPTVQLDGVAWTQLVVGNTVYVGGNFQTARPYGSAAGQNTVARPYMLAYDIRTGELINSFAPTFNGQVLGLAASSDGTRIYAVGAFTNVNGTNKYRMVALNASNGSVIQSFNAGFDAQVKAIAINGDAIYVGGTFSKAGSFTRSKLAAVRASDGAVLNWAPTANASTTALAMSSDKSKVIVGGSYTQLNGAAKLGLGAVDATTGVTVPWATGNIITNSGTNAGITSLTNVDGAVYGTGYVFGDGQNGNPKGNLEAVFAAEPDSGALRWMADCHGDHYSAWGGSGVAYAVGHAHQCQAVGGFPQTGPAWTFHRALAFTAQATGVNKRNTDGGYFNYEGVAAPKPLTWYPDLAVGSITGQSQAAWSVSGNSDYVVLGGEFTRVNGKLQQGLTRFARVELAPNKEGAELHGANFKPALNSPATGLVKGRIQADYDMDNESLTYNVYRQGVAQPIYTTQVNSTFWNRPFITFSDANDIQAGVTYKYRVQVVDPHGNTVTGDWTDVVGSSNAMGQYGLRVLNDNPNVYYRLNEPSGATVNDAWGANNGTVVGNPTRNVTGAISGDSDKAYSFPGTSGNFVHNNTQALGPQKFAVEAWFKTNTTQGGKIVGFGGAASGESSNYDRHIYMQNNGKLTFGVYTGAVKTISTSASYNNNQWHHAVGQLSEAGLQFYVDGVLIGTDPTVTTAENFNGYWRVGGDNLNGWSNQPSSAYFKGDVDEVAVYDSPLTPNQVAWHWSLSGLGGPPPNVLPNAAFTSTPGVRTASFNAAGSTDEDGTITSYEWNFGDGQTGTGVAPSHNYAVGGTYAVTLKVTDNLGGQKSISQDVVVADPPPNQAPTAAFTAVGGERTATFNAVGSTDSDGTIASYEWEFGDGQTGTGINPTHPYAVGGTYNVKLKVTDNQGAINELTKSVVVTDPPPNQAPVAAFDAAGGELTASLNAAGSSDADGTIASYAWDFGDGQIGTGVNATHPYAAAGTYTVKLTVTDDDGAATELSKQVNVLAVNPAIALDDFSRTTANGWGTSDRGGAWTPGGSAANFAVNGGVGVITIPTGGQTRTASLNSLSTTSADTTVDIKLDRPTVASSYVSVIGRKVGNSDYRVKLRFFENGDVYSTLVRVVNGTETSLGGGKINGMVFNSGDTLRVRIQASGQGTSALKTKIWKASDAQPAGWTVQASDSTAALQVAGGIGLSVYAAGTVANVPYPVKFDNLYVVPVAG